MANSEDPYEILHKMLFPQGLHCLLRLKESLAGGGGLVSIRLCGLPFKFGIWHKGFFAIIFYPKVYFIFWVLKRTVSLRSFLSKYSMDSD